MYQCINVFIQLCIGHPSDHVVIMMLQMHFHIFQISSRFEVRMRQDAADELQRQQELVQDPRVYFGNESQRPVKLRNEMKPFVDHAKNDAPFKLNSPKEPVEYDPNAPGEGNFFSLILKKHHNNISEHDKLL